MPLQLISSFSFMFLFLAHALSTPLVAKHGCQERCGNFSIPFPFGIGKGCSLEPSFDIACRTSSQDPPIPYLTYMNAEVVEINTTYIRVKYPLILVSACYDSSGYKSSSSYMSVNFSGSPYTLSESNWLTAMGCDDMLLQYTNGTSVSGGCSAFCAEKNDLSGVGYCPVKQTTVGYGCCQTEILAGTDFLGARLGDLSRKLPRTRLFPCSHAFIRERSYANETVFSYPLHYLDNSTALVNDNWASKRSPVVRLDWKITTAENCSQAKENPNTYACRDNKSVCVDSNSDEFSFEYIGRGYLCSCVPEYEGNPYLAGGCQAISFSSSIAKNGCSDQCGEIAIPYPFGVGPQCSFAPSFDISCNTSTNPPIPYLTIFNEPIVHLDSSQVRVIYPNLGFSCYNLSDNQRRLTKTDVRSLVVDLSGTEYTLSNENSIVTIGCDDMVVATNDHTNRSFISSTCAAVCEENQDYGDCRWGRDAYYPGDGCCRSPIPKGTTYLKADLTDFSGRWPRTNFSCGYAFVSHDYRGDFHLFGHTIESYDTNYPILNNSTGISLDNPFDELGADKILALEWRIGSTNCKEASSNPTTFACQSNSDCIDFDAMVGGYLCNCSKGYQGNPYLPHGCQDIDECADNTTNSCNSNSSCVNTVGSFYCSCPKRHFGDGMKDGSGCIKLTKSKSKMIILTGIGSGLGFLLLVLMCLWLYKMLQKRKEKMLREKFFKRNGGLLLRQQTNEGTLGKTKVFSAKELEIATDHFSEIRILGHGGQGTVYKGMLSDGKIVAIKKSKLVEANQLEPFINEVAILSQINHRNVVKLLGCCLETEVPLLVYEFMPNGTLFDLIHDPNNEFPFPWNMRLKIATDIAGALAYLHSSSSMPIYHRDIKSSNILLDEKYVVKVSDFGTSKSVDVDQTHLTTMVKGTFGYLDPEYFQSSQFTEKSDVYSFGVVLVELLTGQRPISLNKTDEDRGLAARFLTSMEEDWVDTILDPQVLEQHKKGEVILVAKLAQRCLNSKGKMRPTMKEVVTELESLKISQSVSSKDEYEEVIHFEHISRTTSDTDYTWSASYKSVTPSSSVDTHPLMFKT